MTRQQQYLRRALDHVEAMRSQSIETQAIYARLCHRVPVLLRANGLCQTLAFMQDSASGEQPRALAYRTLLEHLRVALMDEVGDTVDVMSVIAELPTTEYIRCTRALMAALVYYKRFASSSLTTDVGVDQ